MTIEDFFKIKGEVDNKHYIVLKSITANKTFKSIKTYTITVYTEEQLQTNEIYKVQKTSQTNLETWNDLEKELIKIILNGRDINK